MIMPHPGEISVTCFPSISHTSPTWIVSSTKLPTNAVAGISSAGQNSLFFNRSASVTRSALSTSRSADRTT